MSNTTAVKEIRAVTEDWAQAMRDSDLPNITKHYANEVVAYDAIKQLQFVGREAYAQHWEYCMTMCPPGSMIFDMNDLVTHADEKVGFSYFLCRCGGIDERGEEKFSWMRVTRGLLKVNGTWLVVHEHFSCPFDMESGMALFDAQP